MFGFGAEDGISQILIASALIFVFMSVLIGIVLKIDNNRRRESYLKGIVEKTKGGFTRANYAIRAAENAFLKESLRGDSKFSDLVRWSSMKRDMRKAGLPGRPELLPVAALAMSWVIAQFVLGIPSHFVSAWIVAVGIFPFAYIFLRSSIINMFIQNRRLLMMSQLVMFIEFVQRGVSVGVSADLAVSEAIKESEQPLKNNIIAIKDLLDLGYDFVEAINLASDRVDLPEFDIFAASLTAQSTTGGSIGDVLKEVIEIARSRVDLQKKVSSMTGEGRFNALLLGSLPIGLLIYLRSTQPDYFASLWVDGQFLGPIIYAGTIFGAVFGAWFAMRIAAIKI